MSGEATSTARSESVIVSGVLVYAIIDLRSSRDYPLGDAIETLIRREDAERFIEEVRGDDPEMAAKLRIEERGGSSKDHSASPLRDVYACSRNRGRR